MSYNSLFGNPTHPRTNIHNDPVKANLGTKLNNVRDRRHTQKEIPIFDVANSVIYQPVSTYGASLLDTTSLADLRAQILENSNEEAIRLLADGNNEINFYTGGVGASNLKLQILNGSIDVKNGATIYCFDLIVDPNRSFLASYVGSDTGNNLNLRYGSSVYQQFNASGITTYQNTIPSGSLDIGATATRFNNIYNNISTITNEIRLNTFAPVGSDYRQKGIFFRDGFNGSSNGDNMCIRSIERNDAGTLVGDRLALSSYGGISVNYFTNDAGNDGATGRIALFHDEITVHKNILPNADGTLDIGFKNSGTDDKF
jgi:hypothetical protein